MIILDKDLCLSGGAIGADLTFGESALKANHGLIHWSFAKHEVKSQRDNVVELPHSELIQADDHLMLVKSFVKRSYPCKSQFVNNLLRRNYFQVRDSGSCYAVSEIIDNQVQGGTAWAVALFLFRFNYEACNCYVFCQKADHWFKWNGLWETIDIPPRPSDIYAGIGSRKLQKNGEMAISKLFEL